MNKTTLLQFSIVNNLFSDNQTIIIGLSGGPDSIFLLYFFHTIKIEYNLTIIAAHLDHEWRKNSHEDSAFCYDICQKLNIPFISAKASELNIIAKKMGSKEALGRRLRRVFLEQVCQQFNGNAIALAHHEQDQQETFFIRLIRGTSLTGLTAMKPKSGYYIRPLLQTSKEDILAYLHKHNIPYLIDPTNSSENHLRNRIRLNVLPALEKTDSRFNANFLRSLTSLQKTEQFLYNLTAITYKELIVNEASIDMLNFKKLLSLDNFLQKKVILYWLIEHNVTFTPTEKLLNEIHRFLLQKKNNSHMLHTSWKITKKYNNVFIEKI